MGSSHPLSDAFEPEDLDRIEAAFNGIWAAIASRDPFRNTENDDELKLIIRQKLFALAKSGVVDPDLLTKLTLETSPLLGLPNGRD